MKLICKNNPSHKLRLSVENPGYHMCDVCHDGWTKDEISRFIQEEKNKNHEFLFKLENLNDNNVREYVAYVRMSPDMVKKIKHAKQHLTQLKESGLEVDNLQIHSSKFLIDCSLKIYSLKELEHVNQNQIASKMGGASVYKIKNEKDVFHTFANEACVYLRVKSSGISLIGSYGSYWLDTDLFESCIELSWSHFID